jgi:hypothetical protein
MAASAALTGTYEYMIRNRDITGSNLIAEFHTVTYAGDATVEVPTNLNHIDFVLVGPSQDVTAPTANILGCDGIITTGAVTVGATANNSDTYWIAFYGTL